MDVFTSLIGCIFTACKRLRSDYFYDNDCIISPLPDNFQHEGSDPHSFYICHYQRVVCYANVVICVAIFHKFSSLVAFVNDVAIYVQFVGFCSHAFRTRDGHHAFVRIQSCLPVCLSDSSRLLHSVSMSARDLSFSLSARRRRRLERQC